MRTFRLEFGEGGGGGVAHEKNRSPFVSGVQVTEGIGRPYEKHSPLSVHSGGRNLGGR